MRLDEFRVQNYKKVRDTGWVECRDLTVLVGKNEAGKSAIFRGLSKLNPSDGERYDGLKEFPRSRFTTEFTTDDWPVVSACLLLSPEEQAELVKLCPALVGVTHVVCTRHYSWKLAVEFAPPVSPAAVSCPELAQAIDNLSSGILDLTAPEGRGDALGALKQAAKKALETARSTIPAEGLITEAQAKAAIDAVRVHSNEPWQKDLLEPHLEPLYGLSKRAVVEVQLQEARTWVGTHLPKFVYFDRYDVLEAAIHIPLFLDEIAKNIKLREHRVTHCLFKHVGLDLKQMLSLGVYATGQPLQEAVRRTLDESAIRANSASICMTNRFRDWWEQRRHQFRYDFQGEYFRIWVSDDLDPSEIELDQRSQGLQYFFSFYLVFLVESEGEHQNAILLLDEPGLHLHGTAQAKVVQFLAKLSKDNQTLYSTHSPFMIDADHLERTRAVYEGEDGTTKVSGDVWPRDKDSLFPLQAALGYQLAQALFIGKRQTIVEGISDYWLLKALSDILPGRGFTGLRQDVILLPAGGLTHLLPLASMLIGHHVEVAALLDGDEPGRREGKKLVDKLLAGQDRKCLFLGDFTGFTEAEVEDLFLEPDYFSAVQAAYPGVVLDFTAEERALKGVANKMTALFKRKGLGKFDKWKPAAVLRDRILAKPAAVAAKTCQDVGKIFTALNGLFSGEGEA
jgi:AAA ATPase-like protein